MKITKIILFLIGAIVFFNCSSQKSKTIEVTELTIGPVKGFRYTLPKDTTYKIITISCYKILNMDSISISPIKILNIDSLKKRIKYPILAERAGVEGNVLIELRFNDNGEINKIKSVSSIGVGLEDSVKNDLKDFKFIFDGKVKSRETLILLIVNFHIMRQSTIKVH